MLSMHVHPSPTTYKAAAWTTTSSPHSKTLLFPLAFHSIELVVKMSQYNGTSLRGFDPFAVHSFTSGGTRPQSSADGAHYATNTPSYSASASALPSPPASPRQIPRSLHASVAPVSVPIGNDLSVGNSVGSAASYSDHLSRALSAPPQTFLASQQLPAPSWPDVYSTPISPASSSSGLSSSPSSLPSHSRAQSSTHVFTDFRAEVERYRNEGNNSSLDDDLPALKSRKTRERVYAGY